MITLTLLHPVQLKPVQCWTFDDESVIRIGRSTDNQVVLYSAVVSRYHVELRRVNSVWEIESLGANGTYLDGKRMTQVPVRNGMIIRLARSGPNIQIHVGVSASYEADKLAGERTLSQRAQSDSTVAPDAHADTTQPLSAMETLESKILERSTDMEPPSEKRSLAGGITCNHLRKTPDFRFCIDCGAPLSLQQTIGDYQIVKLLGEGEVGFTYLVWRQGKHQVLKTLTSEWVKHLKALGLFEQEAKALSQLSHPSLPQVLDFFTIEQQPYLVVELIYGRSLFQQVTKWGAIPQKQAIGWMLELCEVLEYLHQQSPPVLHQDIRPHNLIRRSTPTAFREISLVDFGAVKGLGLEAKNRTSAIGYSAPEQREGKASPASDLYSLGTTLAFLLSGQDPSEFYRYREQGYRFYAEYVPGLTPEIVQVIRQLTHPEVGDRYTSAQEVAEALRQVT